MQLVSKMSFGAQVIKSLKFTEKLRKTFVKIAWNSL